MAEPETEPDEISVRAAEVAAEVTEAESPQERQRLAAAFAKAASSSARVAGHGTRAARRGIGAVVRGAGSGTSWLAAQVTAMAPRLRVRDQAALRAQFPGRSAEEIADTLIDGASRASAAAGGAVGVWAAVILIRSVLRPLNQLRTGAVELAEVRLPDALRDGGRGPLAVRAVGISSSDEIGEIARALDQVQTEMLGLTSNDAGLRGKLGEMFVELSSRSQTLVERQIRLIDELEQGERDAGRTGHQAPGLVSSDLELPVLRRAARDLEGDLVLARRQIDFLAVGRFASGCGGFR